MAFTIRNEDGGQFRIYHADTIEDVVNYLESTPRPRRNCGTSSTEPKSSDWSGTRTYAEALELVRNGWPKGRDMLAHDLDSALVVQKPSLTRCERLDVGGAYPFIPAAVAGDPACMVATGLEQSKTKPIIRFVVNIGGLAGISGATMMRRGAAILSWVDHLERNDFRVEVMCIQTNNTRQRRPSASNNVFMAKAASDPLDIDRCAFLLANSAVFRRFIFGVWERDPDLAEMWGYGSSNDTIHPSVMIPHSVYFPKPYREGDWATSEMAVARVTSIVRSNISFEEFQEAA